MTWRIEGLSTRGRTGSSDWTARAAKAYAVGVRYGVFRFQPVKTLVLEKLDFELTPRQQPGSASAPIRNGVDQLAETIAEQSQASRVSIEGFHVDILDEAGELRCCLRAEKASWQRRDGTDIELAGGVRVRTGNSTQRSESAALRSAASTVAAENWERLDDAGPDVHPAAASTEACPLELATRELAPESPSLFLGPAPLRRPIE